MKETKVKICDNNFDIHGLTICRVCKQGFLTKFFPIGNNISGNLKFKDLLSMWIEHKFGEKIAYITTKYEKRVHQAKNLQIKVFYKLKRLIGKA